jgi:hypothetical protein
MDKGKSISTGAIVGILAALVAVIGAIFYFTTQSGGAGQAGTGKGVTLEEERAHKGGQSPAQMQQSMQQQYGNGGGGRPAGR